MTNRQDRLLETHQLDTVGLPYPVTVRHGIFERLNPVTGEVLGHGIPDLEGLLAAVAMLRALHPARLSGLEVRFLRKALDMSVEELSRALTSKPETLARWEESSVDPGEQTERLLRLLVAETLKARAPAVDYDPGAVLALPLVAMAEPPRLVLERIVFKDGLTRRRSQAWDGLPAAA